ncbi:hypothetical protein [Zobellia nedashkovskayae]|uniref:hypothetical protein n=1 Tax=Zobellia nedashkovskayae TaxID=2779510 RepID=UPI00188AAAD9|nr:hypothetical protein [Zobellia nedashkovskayae]
MKIEKKSENRLFEKHQKSVVKRWNKTLKYGFFKRAWGGHANDGDEFGIWLKYQNRTELFEILDRLQIELKLIPENYPKAINGKKYGWEEFERFKSEIKEFPEFEQPKHIKIAGILCFCWIANGIINLKFSGQENGNGFEVTETDFENCVLIEKMIADKGLENYVSSDYENSVTNISKKVYPELFD